MHKKIERANWLLRYWVLDKYAPQCRAFGFLAANVISAIVVVMWIVHLATPAHAAKVQKGYIDPGLIYLFILLVTLVLSYALRPKPPNAVAETGQQPTTKDGRALRRAYGTNWIDDSSMVAWVNGSPEPIKSSGGKK